VYIRLLHSLRMADTVVPYQNDIKVSGFSLAYQLMFDFDVIRRKTLFFVHHFHITSIKLIKLYRYSKNFILTIYRFILVKTTDTRYKVF